MLDFNRLAELDERLKVGGKLDLHYNLDCAEVRLAREAFAAYARVLALSVHWDAMVKDDPIGQPMVSWMARATQLRDALENREKPR